MNLNLTHKHVVITGGASGIGRASAVAFAEEGAHVSVWDRIDGVVAMARDIADQHKSRAVGVRVDVTDEGSLQQALIESVAEVGPVDHVVHAAAMGSGKFGFPFTNLQPADWRRVIDVNIMGMTNVAHVLTPHLRERGAGSFVFVASIAGQVGSQTDPPYSASKAANINFAQCMAKDLAPLGIRVNTVCPGMVQTPLNRGAWQAWHDQAAPDERLSYDEWAGRKIKALVPLGKWQSPEAIADMIVFLSSDRAEHVTGQTINVDGGFVMHW